MKFRNKDFVLTKSGPKFMEEKDKRYSELFSEIIRLIE